MFHLMSSINVWYTTYDKHLESISISSYICQILRKMFDSWNLWTETWLVTLWLTWLVSVWQKILWDSHIPKFPSQKSHSVDCLSMLYQLLIIRSSPPTNSMGQSRCRSLVVVFLDMRFLSFKNTTITTLLVCGRLKSPTSPACVIGSGYQNVIK